METREQIVLKSRDLQRLAAIQPFRRRCLARAGAPRTCNRRQSYAASNAAGSDEETGRRGDRWANTWVRRTAGEFCHVRRSIADQRDTQFL